MESQRQCSCWKEPPCTRKSLALPKCGCLFRMGNSWLGHLCSWTRMRWWLKLRLRQMPMTTLALMIQRRSDWWWLSLMLEMYKLLKKDCTIFTIKNIRYFPFVPPLLCVSQLQSKCHYILNHNVQIISTPLRGGGGGGEVQLICAN